MTPAQERELAALRALRDELIADYTAAGRAVDMGWEFTTQQGNGVNAYAAIAVLAPLHETARQIARPSEE